MSDTRHYRLALIFDVETNGLIPRNDPVTKLPPPITECPHIIQMSFIIYNMYEHNIEKTYNVYINIPNEVEISNKITELTGITREMCNDGISIVEALSEFHEAYSACDCVIAHNLDFDSKMMLIEIERNSQLLLEKNPKICDIFQTKVNIKSPERFCTMMSSIGICGILVTSVDKSNKSYKYKKFPKLSETYEHLFKYVPDNLHNSMMDCLVCLRCYLKIRHGVNVNESKFKYWLDKYLH